eukprot:7256876-Pyramimonas_sp.AAC.1
MRPPGARLQGCEGTSYAHPGRALPQGARQAPVRGRIIQRVPRIPYRAPQGRQRDLCNARVSGDPQEPRTGRLAHY